MRKFTLVGARSMVFVFVTMYLVGFWLVWNFVPWGEWWLFALDLIGIFVAIYVSHRMVQEGWVKSSRLAPPGTAIILSIGVVLAMFHGFAALTGSMSRSLSLSPIVAIVAIAIVYVLMEWKQPKHQAKPQQSEK